MARRWILLAETIWASSALLLIWASCCPRTSWCGPNILLLLLRCDGFGGIGLSERTDEKHCADLYQDNFFSDRNHFSRRQWYLDHVIKPIDPNYASDLENGTLHIRTPWMEQNRDRLLKNGTTGGYMFSLGTDHVPKAGALNTRTLVDLNGRDPHWCKVK